jgi:ABC-type transport system involved in multi-copper enzyme maturation permease subunit
MGPILAIARSVLADAVRRKVIWSVAVVALIMVVAIRSLPTYGVGVVVSAVYREFALAVSYIAALVVTLALSANRIPGEVERRTVYSVLAKRVARWQYLIGTWLGLWAVMGVVLLAFGLIDVGFGIAAYGTGEAAKMLQMLQGVYGIWLIMGIAAAVTVLATARFGPVTGVVATLVFLFVTGSKGTLFGENPKGILAALYPSMDTFNIINQTAHGTGVSIAYLAVMAAAFVAWIAIALGLAVVVFNGRDL